MIKYYTDQHIVDEDERAISVHGGYWDGDSQTGVMDRHVCDPSSNNLDVVASRRRHWKLIKYYTDWHDVDEDRVTILYQGGYWREDIKVGMTQRHIDVSPNHSDDVDGVASSNMKNSLIIRMVIMSTKT